MGAGIAPVADLDGAGQGEDDQQAQGDPVAPQGTLAPPLQGLGQEGHPFLGDVLGGLVQGGHDAVGPLDLDLPHPAVDLGQVGITLGLEALALAFVLDGHGGVGVVNGKEPAGGQALLAQGALPGGHDVLRVIFAGRRVQLVEDVKKLSGVRTADGLTHQVLEGIAHGPRLGVAGVEEHQHQVGEIDDVIGDPQGGGALGVGIEARGIDEDFAAQGLAGTGLELQVGVDAAPLARRHLFDVP